MSEKENKKPEMKATITFESESKPSKIIVNGINDDGTVDFTVEEEKYEDDARPPHGALVHLFADVLSNCRMAILSKEEMEENKEVFNEAAMSGILGAPQGEA